MINDRPSHSPLSPPSSAREADSSAAARATRKGPRALLAALLRGSALGGAAFLLGSCPLLFGSAPLGLALLAASSAYTWYVLAGLLLSAALHPVTLSGWTWAGVYILCVILRLMVRFFVDPPTLPDGRPCRGRTYLALCWRSFKHNAGLAADVEDDNAYTDYYEGVEDGFHTDGSPRGEGQQEAAARAFHPRLFAEHPLLRLLAAAVCGLAAGVFGLITRGFHMYDLLATLCMLLLTPIAAFLLIACFGEAGLTLLFSPTPLESHRQGTRRRERVVERFHALPLISVCFLLALLVYAARGFSPAVGATALTLPLSTLLGLVFTLLAATRLGIIPGLAVGVICGLAASPALSPLFILCAGGFALLSPISRRAGVIGGCVLGLGWCLAAEGVLTTVTHLFAILLAIPVFYVSDKLGAALGGALPPSATAETAAAEREEEDLRGITSLISSALTLESNAKLRRGKMQALSEAFESLSKRFYNLSSQLRRPRMLDLRRICDDSFERQCAVCRNRDVCWGSEYDRTLETQARLTAQLHTGGRADADSLPDTLQDFCPHIRALVEDINGRCARMTENLLRSEKTHVFAADYAAMAALLTDALEEERRSAEDFTCNREAADAIYDYLSEMGVEVQGVVVGGKPQSPRKRVIVRGNAFSAVNARLPEVKARLEEICGVKLSPPSFDTTADFGNERGAPATIMTLWADTRLSTAYSASTVPAGFDPRDPLPPPLTSHGGDGPYEPPAVCGDHIALFKTDEAYFYALISDGMGAGDDASMTSDICAMFLEKMLSAGNRVDISLRMLDTYVHSKNTGTGEECSATVDLMELDLMDGQAVFAKNGAAPTYVVRDGTVYKLRCRTMPIGILKDTPPQLLKFRMHPGDVVVMVSDGVTLGNDECPWLMDLLSSPMPTSMDSLRLDIIRRALSAGSEDDLSALAIRVEETDG